MTPIASLAGPIVRLQPDSRLVALTREGHEPAFEEIVRRYRTALVRFAAGIGPGSSAEDVVQESLARAHVAITGSNAEITLRPWLYTIVRNRALNARRDERPHEQLDPEYDGVPQPPTIAAEREELAATVAAIQALPIQQRDAIVKRELEGMSHDDIAAHLGVSKGSVRQLIFRARTTLRDGLGCLVPLPVVRSLLESEGARVATAGAGAGAVVAAGGGGGAIGIKGGVALVVAGLALGSGVAIHHHGKGQDDHVALAAPSHHPALKGKEAASKTSSGTRKSSGDGDGASAGSPAGRADGDGSSSHSSGSTGDDSSGSGGGSGETGRHGSGGGGSSEGSSHESGDDSSGPGGGGDDDAGDTADHGGSGSGTSGGDGGDPPSTGGDDSSSGNSGPGGGDSGSSGSGSSGHGGGDDGGTDDPLGDITTADGD